MPNIRLPAPRRRWQIGLKPHPQREQRLRGRPVGPVQHQGPAARPRRRPAPPRDAPRAAACNRRGKLSASPTRRRAGESTSTNSIWPAKGKVSSTGSAIMMRWPRAPRWLIEIDHRRDIAGSLRKSPISTACELRGRLVDGREFRRLVARARAPRRAAPRRSARRYCARRAAA